MTEPIEVTIQKRPVRFYKHLLQMLPSELIERIRGMTQEPFLEEVAHDDTTDLKPHVPEHMFPWHEIMIRLAYEPDIWKPQTSLPRSRLVREALIHRPAQKEWDDLINIRGTGPHIFVRLHARLQLRYEGLLDFIPATSPEAMLRYCWAYDATILLFSYLIWTDETPTDYSMLVNPTHSENRIRMMEYITVFRADPGKFRRGYRAGAITGGLKEGVAEIYNLMIDVVRIDPQNKHPFVRICLRLPEELIDQVYRIYVGLQPTRLFFMRWQ